MSTRSGLATILTLALAASCAARPPSTEVVHPPESILVAPTALTPGAATSAAAVRVDSREVGGVQVLAYAATLPSGRDCWTFLTRGRASTGRPELVVTLARREGERFESAAADAHALLKVALVPAPNAAEWTPWSWRALETRIFGRDDIGGVAAVPARAPAGVLVPDASLALMPLTRVELDIVRMHGVPRVATMLARAQDVHPTPWWVERERPSVATTEEHRREAWGTTSGTFQPGITAFLDVTGEPVLIPKRPGEFGGWQLEGTWRLRVTPAAAKALADHLEDLSPRFMTALAIAPDELAGSTFVWVPDGRGPQLARGMAAPTRPAVVLLGFFAKKVRMGAELVDDGVFISLSNEQREAVVAALRNGTDVEIEPPTEGMMRWRLEWNR